MSYFALLLLFSLLIVARGALDVSVVQSLIDRVLSRASVPLKFNPRLIIDENSVENEYFMIYSEKNIVCLRSNTLVGLSAAFGHYLRYVVKVTHSPTHSLAYSLTYSLTQSLTHSLTYSLTR